MAARMTRGEASPSGAEAGRGVSVIGAPDPASAMFAPVCYGQAMKRVLFLCSQNKLRSPTAEQVFASWPGIEVSSAGLNHDAEAPLTAEMVREADLIFVMEKAHRSRLSRRFKAHLGRARVVCLDIPDDYGLMDAARVDLLRARVPRPLR